MCIEKLCPNLREFVNNLTNPEQAIPQSLNLGIRYLDWLILMGITTKICLRIPSPACKRSINKRSGMSVLTDYFNMSDCLSSYLSN